MGAATEMFLILIPGNCRGQGLTPGDIVKVRITKAAALI